MNKNRPCNNLTASNGPVSVITIYGPLVLSTRLVLTQVFLTLSGLATGMFSIQLFLTLSGLATLTG
jgi:hypothetical protein